MFGSVPDLTHPNDVRSPHGEIGSWLASPPIWCNDSRVVRQGEFSCSNWWIIGRFIAVKFFGLGTCMSPSELTCVGTSACSFDTRRNLWSRQLCARGNESTIRLYYCAVSRKFGRSVLLRGSSEFGNELCLVKLIHEMKWSSQYRLVIGSILTVSVSLTLILYGFSINTRSFMRKWSVE